MNPEERKKWIDRMTAIGVPQEKAEEVFADVEARLEGMIEIFAAGLTASVSTQINQTLSAVENLKATVAPPEPPPVEIPRRVVLTTATLNGQSLAGEVGTLKEVRDDGYYIRLDSQTLRPRLCAGEREFIELKLTPAEQRRLLLEQMSRENWGRVEGFAATQRQRGHYLNTRGQVAFLTSMHLPMDTPSFPSATAAAKARDAVIRAGLAPEEWEVRK